MNDRTIIERVLSTAEAALSRAEAWHRLGVRSGRYFHTPDGPLPGVPGWYIIQDRTEGTLYVGEAADLNKRLNSNQGSLDNFGNSKRRTDGTRNFLKTLIANGVLAEARVGIIAETDIATAVNVASPLGKHDRCNVEKVLDIFRERLPGRRPADR